MKIAMAEKLIRAALTTTATILISSATIPKVHAREVKLDTLCQKFPLNSRCQGDKSSTAIAARVQQVIKLKLETSGSDDEWIRLERMGNTVKLLHTTRVKTVFSQVINGISSAAPIPIPRIFNFYKWDDHPTTKVAFMSDSCLLLQRLKLSKDCKIIGTDTLLLAEEIDIRRGKLTIEYREGDLLRSITFRLPVKDS